MSITGIDKVKTTSSIFVGTQKKGMTNHLSSDSAYINAVFNLNNSYTSNNHNSYSSSNEVINVIKTLTNPQSNFVNLGFSFINVSSSLQSQVANEIGDSVSSLVVNNDLNYTHTSNKQENQILTTKVLNVLSSNSEYEITLNLDNKSLPEVEIFYPNVAERVEIELDEETVWS